VRNSAKRQGAFKSVIKWSIFFCRYSLEVTGHPGLTEEQTGRQLKGKEGKKIK